ncbi:MAG: hypothetical protein V1740_04175 [Candidatus Woesearchaeota archaeon]
MGRFDFLFRKRRDIELLMGIAGHVYGWDGVKLRKVGGSGNVYGIAFINGTVYEAGIGGIARFALKKSSYQPEVLGKREVADLVCLHHGEVYGADNGKPTQDAPNHEVFWTLNDSVIARRDSKILALCSHQGKLYDGGEYGLFDTLSNEKISGEPCEALCSHKGHLFKLYAGSVYDFRVGEEKFFESLLISLCSHNGVLLGSLKCRGVINIEDQIPIISGKDIAIAKGHPDDPLDELLLVYSLVSAKPD